MKWIVRIGLLTLLLAPRTSLTHACSCAPTPDVPTALAESAAVFRGTALSVVPEDDSGLYEPGDHRMRATFQVHETWKGPQTTTILVITELNGSLCQMEFFEQGQEYLIYAFRRGDGSLGVSICGRTTTDPGSEPAALGPGKIPTEPGPTPIPTLSAPDAPTIAPAPAPAPQPAAEAPRAIKWTLLLWLSALVVAGGVFLLRYRSLRQR